MSPISSPDAFGQTTFRKICEQAPQILLMNIQTVGEIFSREHFLLLSNHIYQVPERICSCFLENHKYCLDVLITNILNYNSFDTILIKYFMIGIR